MIVQGKGCFLGWPAHLTTYRVFSLISAVPRDSISGPIGTLLLQVARHRK
jgi:hypothetical protein